MREEKTGSGKFLCPSRGAWLLLALLAACLSLMALPVSVARAETAVTTSPNENDARARIEALRVAIAHHDELYFRKATPEITDFEYDRLKRELRDLAQQFPELAAANGVGDDRTGLFPTYRHRERMLSLAKSHSESDLRAFLGKMTTQLGRKDLVYVIEPKFDGLAISVTYENGRLVRAVTRGNGIEGDDVTANVQTIRGLPTTLRATAADGTANLIPELVELRGEIYLGLAEFARINRERESAGESTFATPRNLAAGTIKLLDPAEVASRKLEIVFYGWGAWQPAATAPESQQDLLARLRNWGLPTVDNFRVAKTADEVWNAVQAFGRERSGFSYPTDGAVVKLDAVAQRRIVGANDEVPFWANAFKFAPERIATRLRSITLQVGRTGVLTPVAELEPVQVGGTTISRASLHNRDEVERADLRIGDYVWVEKAGEIIPQVTGVDLSRRSPDAVAYEFPANCPACGTALTESTAESAVRCPNNACAAQVRRRVEYFASRACLGIDGLGPATVDALVESGCVKDVADLYELTRDDFRDVPRVGESSATRILAAIERSKRAELWRFILGVGISGVGPAKAKALAQRHGSLEAFADSLESPESRELVQQLIAAGVQPKTN